MRTLRSLWHEGSSRRTALPSRPDGSGEPSYGSNLVAGVVRFAVQSRQAALILASALLVGIAGCGPSSQGPPKGSAEPAAEPSSVSASIIKPERRAIPLTVRRPGSIQAFEQPPMFA